MKNPLKTDGYTWYAQHYATQEKPPPMFANTP